LRSPDPPGDPATRIKELEAALRLLRNELARKDIEVRAAQMQRDHTRKQLAEAEQRAKDIASEASKIAEPAARVQELVRELDELRTQNAELDQRCVELRDALAARDRTITELRRDLQDSIGWGKQEPTDDLKLIKGIGQKFERVLHSAGIRRLQQIASWTESDIESIAEKIGIPAERIRRENWVEKARRALTPV
jgi:predicted flap endonuclease-1-like 5' DNA nuclease